MKAKMRWKYGQFICHMDHPKINHEQTLCLHCADREHARVKFKNRFVTKYGFEPTNIIIRQSAGKVHNRQSVK